MIKMEQSQKTEGLESVLVETDFGGKEYAAGHPVIASPPKDGPCCTRLYSALDHSQVSRSAGRKNVRGFIQSLDTRFSDLVDSFTLKTAGELEEGEYVLLEKDDVRARGLHTKVYFSDNLRGSLYFVVSGADETDIIESFASEGKKYLNAKEKLFADAGGRTVPRFQHELLSAAVNMGLADQNVLDKLAEGTIQPSDIERAADHLFREYSKLQDDKIIVGPLTDYLLRERSEEFRGHKPFKARGAFRSYFLNSSPGNPAGAPRNLDVLVGIALSMDHPPFTEMYYDAIGKDSRSPDTFWGSLNIFYDARDRRVSGRNVFGEGGDLYEENLYAERVRKVSPLES